MQQATEPADTVRVEPVERLVEDQHARIPEQRPGQAEPLAHAEREPADAASRDIGQPGQPEDLIDPPPGQPGDRGDDPQVLSGAAPRVERVAVQGGAHLAYRVGQLMVRQAADGRRPGRRGGQPEQDAERSGLARPVRSQKAGHLARPDLEGQVIDAQDRSEALGEILNPDRGHRLSFRPVDASTLGSGAAPPRRRKART
jgi:hypothetical protein